MIIEKLNTKHRDVIWKYAYYYQVPLPTASNGDKHYMIYVSNKKFEGAQPKDANTIDHLCSNNAQGGTITSFISDPVMNLDEILQ